MLHRKGVGKKKRGNSSRRKGYKTEWKIKKIFEKAGWKVIRAGGSLGEADLVCIKSGRCILIQVKSTRNKTFYYYEYMKKKLEGFPFYLVIDFGYGNIRVTLPKAKINLDQGMRIEEFLLKI